MLTPAEAERIVRAHMRPLAVESLPLAQCAGAVLREEVCAERDQPPFDRVAMDGIAIAAEAVRAGRRQFKVQGVQAAGDAPHSLRDATHCIEIMTGAMLPAGCDAVVPVERIARQGDVATLEEGFDIQAWKNVHRRASDTLAGAQVLAPGTVLHAPEIAVAAAAGRARLQVGAQPAVMVVSTGSELVEPGEAIEPHQVRRSNAYGLVAQLRLRGLTRVADDHAIDDPQVLRDTLERHLATHDVLVLTGGVSAGRLDLVPKVLGDLGVQKHFHKIAQRPGMPMWFGVAPSGTAVFGLPGNPVSTLVCLARYVLPALSAAAGRAAAEPEVVALAAPVRITPPLAYFLPVRLVRDAAGAVTAQPRPTNGSGDFTSLVGTDGFVQLPPGPNEYAARFVAPLYRW